METRYFMRLSFRSDEQEPKIGHITIPDAPTTIPSETATRNAMNAIVASGIVRLPCGNLQKPEIARHSKRDRLVWDMKS